MANEIIISAYDTGLDVRVAIYNGDTVIAGDLSCTEILTTGMYQCSMPDSTPYGKYLVLVYLVFVEGKKRIGEGEMYWDGTKEIDPTLYERLHRARGLDPLYPATNTLSQLTAGDIQVNITGDLETTTTYTAQ